MKASTTWRCATSASVRQTAGLTLLPVRSSKGNGTRITLWRIAEWYSVGVRINVLGGVGKKAEGVAGGRRSQPGLLRIGICWGREHRHHESGIGRNLIRLVQDDVPPIVMRL